MPTRIRILLAAVLLALTAAAAAGGPPRETPRNEAGSAVLDLDGHRINYSRAEWLAQTRRVAAPRRIVTSDDPRSRRPPTASSSTVVPAWSFGAFGEGIGLSNIVVSDVGDAREIIVGASQSTFGDDNYWYSLRYDEASREYGQVYVSPRYNAGIRRIVVENIIGGPRPEVVVALADGRIVFHDMASKLALGEVTTLANGLTGLGVVDVDRDGSNEIVICTTTDLFVYTADGNLEWDIPVGGLDLVVSQFDADAGLEIAVTDGAVVDADSVTVQWVWSSGFGVMLEAADIDGDSIAELIAGEDWNFVWAFDIDRQLPKWSIPIFDVGAIDVTDIDGDGVQELLVGEGQWGEVIAFDTVTQQREWSVPNPEHGVTDIAVADVDQDGVGELLWGAGATSTGPDRLYVADWRIPTTEWENMQLDGPFIGPERGDLDGDGVPETVLASWKSEAGYGSGRIIVFDSRFGLRAISEEVVGGLAWTGIHDLALIDVDADGSLEIAVAADELYDGVIEIYDFHSDDTFSLNWTNATQPDGAPFYSVKAADVDSDGQLEIVAGGGREHTGAEGVYIYVYDYASATEEWHSLQMGPYWGSIPGLEFGDFDADGALEIVGMVDGGDAYIFDGPTKVLEGILFGEFSALTTAPPDTSADLLFGDANGDLIAAAYRAGSYGEVSRRNWVSGAVDGVSRGPSRGSFWIGSEGTLRLAKPAKTIWESDDYGPLFGERVLVHPKVAFFVSAGSYTVTGFWVSGDG